MEFRPTNEAKPELQQYEREAIVDLLNLCIYADAFIALKEGDFLSQVVVVIGWDPSLSFSSYSSRSIAAARDAKRSPEARQEFLSRAKSRLPSAASRELAIDLCRQLFAADGKTGEKENTLLAEIKAALS